MHDKNGDRKMQDPAADFHTTATSRRHTILLVDDDVKLLRGLQRSLPEEEYDVFMAISAAEARAILSKRSVDLILCDNLMTGTMGTEFLTEIRKSCPHTVLMMLSGYLPAQAAERMVHEVGVARILLKPCSAADIVTAIGEEIAAINNPFN